MNISLPADQISFIDDLVIQLGYANRSELMRSIVRLIKKEPKVLEPLSSLTFNPPSTKNGDEIMTSFRATGLYSEEFLKDLEDGINNSDYFTKTSHLK